MRPARVVALSAVVLAVVSPAGTTALASDRPAVDRPAAVPVRDAVADRAEHPDPNLNERPDPYLLMNVTVGADGDARWRVTSRFFVRTENETESFRRLVDRVQAGETDPGYSADTFRRFAALAENATARADDMRIVGANWSGEVNNVTARLTLTFTWANFARVDGSRVIVENVFYSPNGTWLPRLADGQRIAIDAPPGYSVDSATAPVSNGTVTWSGPSRFDRGDIRVVYVPIATPPQTPTPTPTPTTPGGPAPPPDEGASPLFWLGLLLLIGAVGAGGYLLARQRGEGGPDETGAAEAETATGGDAEAPGAESAEPAAEAAETAGTAGAEPSPEPEDGAAADDAEPVDPELLSDEERVERMLRENGGRMKQANIVSETGWSNAKVSQLLSSMDEEGRIDKLRIGRENLITLPDEEVAEFDEN